VAKYAHTKIHTNANKKKTKKSKEIEKIEKRGDWGRKEGKKRVKEEEGKKERGGKEKRGKKWGKRPTKKGGGGFRGLEELGTEEVGPHTGWRRLIGSPQLHIIFHKRATKYRSLLRKMTYKDKGSYESSPPHTNHARST